MFKVVAGYYNIVKRNATIELICSLCIGIGGNQVGMGAI